MKLKPGDKYNKEFSISNEDIRSFSKVTGDNNPIHLDKTFARNSGFKEPIAY